MHAKIQKSADLLEGALRGNAKELGHQNIGTHDRKIGRQQWQRSGAPDSLEAEVWSKYD